MIGPGKHPVEIPVSREPSLHHDVDPRRKPRFFSFDNNSHLTSTKSGTPLGASWDLSTSPVRYRDRGIAAAWSRSRKRHRPFRSRQVLRCGDQGTTPRALHVAAWLPSSGYGTPAQMDKSGFQNQI